MRISGNDDIREVQVAHLIEIKSVNGFARAKDTDTATCSCRWVGPARFGPYAYAEAWEDGERHMVNPYAD